MISLAVLSVASLGVMGSLTFGAAASESAGYFSQATQIGREYVENMRVDRLYADPFNPPAGLVDADTTARTPLKDPPFDQAQMSVNTFDDTTAEKFRRNIQITEINPGELARIQVRIYWTVKGRERYVETVAFARNDF